MARNTRERMGYNEDIPPVCLSTIAVLVVCGCFLLANAGRITQTQTSWCIVIAMVFFIVDQALIKRFDAYQALLKRLK